MKMFQTMPCRVSGYELIIEGFEKTKVHLMSFNDTCSEGKDFLIKVFSIVIIVFPILLINQFFDNLIKKMEKFFENNYLISKYVTARGIHINNLRAMWHNAFYNLGYLKDENIEIPEKSDVGSIKWARKINPKIQFFTEDYEKLLKEEYFKIVIKYPFFFIKTILAKLFVILIYFVCFCNVDLFVLFKKSIFKNPRNKKRIIFYSSDLILFGLIGLATKPLYTYILGFYCFSSLLTISLLFERKN